LIHTAQSLRHELGVTLAFLSNSYDADTASIDVSGSKWTDATNATGTKVDSVRRTF